MNSTSHRVKSRKTALFLWFAKTWDRYSGKFAAWAATIECPVSILMGDVKMALVRCPECGREVSDKAAACIHCGCPMSAVVSQTAVNTVAQQPSGGTAPSLSMNFNAVLSGAESEKTMQSVYVPELGRNVEFALDNDTKVGDIIKITLNKGSKYDYILFTAVTVSKVAQAPSAVAPTNTEAIDTIKKYKPNLIARFFKTGFLRKFLGMFLTFLLVGRFGDVDIEDMFDL